VNGAQARRGFATQLRAQHRFELRRRIQPRLPGLLCQRNRQFDLNGRHGQSPATAPTSGRRNLFVPQFTSESRRSLEVVALSRKPAAVSEHHK
jgi:hypothetical protein